MMKRFAMPLSSHEISTLRLLAFNSVVPSSFRPTGTCLKHREFPSFALWYDVSWSLETCTKHSEVLIVIQSCIEVFALNQRPTSSSSVHMIWISPTNKDMTLSERTSAETRESVWFLQQVAWNKKTSLLQHMVSTEDVNWSEGWSTLWHGRSYLSLSAPWLCGDRPLGWNSWDGWGFHQWDWR